MQELLVGLRKKRVHTQPQYMFIQEALCELIVCMGREGRRWESWRLLMDSE